MYEVFRSEAVSSMDYKKTYYAKDIVHRNGNVVVEGPVLANDLAQLTFHTDLNSFRPPLQQHEALINIADRPEGKIIIARHFDTVIGYVTFLYPDPLARWSEGNIENLIELGAIEIIPDFRRGGVGKALLEISMSDDKMEDYIIIATEYYWHWDLKGTSLDIWAYRKVMDRLMMTGGFMHYTTDDPEISSHPANALMARIGKRVDQQSVLQFDALRLKNRFI